MYIELTCPYWVCVLCIFWEKKTSTCMHISGVGRFFALIVVWRVFCINFFVFSIHSLIWNSKVKLWANCKKLKNFASPCSPSCTHPRTGLRPFLLAPPFIFLDPPLNTTIHAWLSLKIISWKTKLAKKNVRTNYICTVSACISLSAPH